MDLGNPGQLFRRDNLFITGRLRYRLPKDLFGNQTPFHGVGRQGRRIMEVQFPHKVRPVFLYGLRADKKIFGHLFVLESLGNKLQDFPLPVCEAIPCGCTL